MQSRITEVRAIPHIAVLGSLLPRPTSLTRQKTPHGSNKTPVRIQISDEVPINSPLQREIYNYLNQIYVLSSGYSSAFQLNAWKFELDVLLKQPDIDPKTKKECREGLIEIGSIDYLGKARWFQECIIFLLGMINRLDVGEELIPPHYQGIKQATLVVPDEIRIAVEEARRIHPTRKGETVDRFRR